jgi:hypothetical protein
MRKKSNSKDCENFNKKLQIDKPSWMHSEPKELPKPVKDQHDKNRELKLEFVRKEPINYNEQGWIRKAKRKECWKNKRELRRPSLRQSLLNKGRRRNCKTDWKMKGKNF